MTAPARSPVDDALDRLELFLRPHHSWHHYERELPQGRTCEACEVLATVRSELERLTEERDKAWAAFNSEVERLQQILTTRTFSTTESGAERIAELEAGVRRLTEGLRDMANETNCRIEHGVGGVAALHLEYVENRLRALLSASPSDGGGAITGNIVERVNRAARVFDRESDGGGAK